MKPSKRKCGECGETDPAKFYGHKQTMCAKCHNNYTIAKGYANRAHALEVLGGSCYACGFDKYPCSLDIHHTDPGLKDPAFNTMRGWSIERLDRELEHCVLLCKNCHSAYHSGCDIGWGRDLQI